MIFSEKMAARKGYTVADCGIGKDMYNEAIIVKNIINQVSFYEVIISIDDKCWKRFIYYTCGREINFSVARKTLAYFRDEIEKDKGIKDKRFLQLKYREHTKDGYVYKLKTSFSKWDEFYFTITINPLNQTTEVPSMFTTILSKAIDFEVFVYEKGILVTLVNVVPSSPKDYDEVKTYTPEKYDRFVAQKREDERMTEGFLKFLEEVKIGSSMASSEMASNGRYRRYTFIMYRVLNLGKKSLNGAVVYEDF